MFAFWSQVSAELCDDNNYPGHLQWATCISIPDLPAGKQHSSIDVLTLMLICNIMTCKRPMLYKVDNTQEAENWTVMNCIITGTF